jgi:hypothetical protein
MRLERWPIDRLLPSARNARTHSKAQVAEIAGSIRNFGFAHPVLVGEAGDVVAGHGRLAAARQLGLREVPVIVLDALNETQRRQLMLADNRIALNAGWDIEMLRLELQDLSSLRVDLSVLGFSKSELANALSPAKAGLTDEDAVPEVEKETTAKAGEIWCLGDHRVACGDSTDPGLVARLLDGTHPNLMVTDPPYGVVYDPEWRHRAGVNNSKRVGKVENDERPDWEAAWALFPGNIAYVWHGALHAAHRCCKPKTTGFYDPRADNLGQGTPRHRPGRLPLAARTLLVCRSRERKLDRGPQANDVVVDIKPGPGRRNRPWHAKAGGMHAPAYSQQHKSE